MYSWTIKNYIFQGENIEIFFTKSKSKTTESVLISNDDTHLLQKHFKAKNIFDLRGQTVTSPKDNLSTAIEILLLKIKNGGYYRAPSHQKVIEICIVSLSKMQVPDLSLVDKETICQSFLKVWGRNLTPSNKWLTEIKRDVKSLSKGVVTIEETKMPKKKLPAVLGPHYYLDLVSRYGRRQTFFIGPYDTPIKFLK